MRIKRAIAGLAVFATMSGTGCATGYRATYGAGAITKEFVTESHTLYSKELNERFDTCDPRTNPESEVTPGNLDELNECMGKHFTKEDAEKIEKALGVYAAAAEALSAALLQTETGKEKLDDAWRDALEAALEALALFPAADGKVKKLRTLLGRMGR